MQTELRYLTPVKIAKRLGVSRNTVRSWIRSGELPALNLARPGSRRPRWRISELDLATFEQRRKAHGQGSAQPPAQRRRKRPSGSTIEFF